ncbi:MAG: hypothetical protein BroJett042_09860 [Bacteroidota bacterium]|nr:MAG: hypothetical protein BroJett042_09860 [Bacteroidota bacterium]HNU43087.1 GxxExxY protein [Cyclobacteriaceae bacterium]
MIKQEYKYSDITEKIIGCAMKVHNYLGNGFQEVIYQRALEIEFRKAELTFNRELQMAVSYDGIKIGTRRVDFLVESKIIVELKAVSKLDNIYLNQAVNYLEAFDLEIGLLLNFGSTSLEFRRLINSKKRNQDNLKSNVSGV